MITPLMKDDSDLLPDTLRLVPLPCSNGDLDVVTQFGQAQMRALLKYTVGEGDHQKAATPEFLCQCLFIATVNRFTGNVSVLRQYENAEIETMHLPHIADASNFVAFLDKLELLSNKPSPFSRQHYQTLPEEVTDNRKNLGHFILALARTEKGFLSLRERVEMKHHEGKGIPRHLLAQWMFDCLDVCGDFQGNTNKLGFLVNKILVDVESLFLGFLTGTPPKTLLGYGSRNGLACINLGDYNNKTEDEKFEQLHNSLLEFYQDPNTPEELLVASGWHKSRDDGSILSCWNGRPYAESDSEHILCKVWLAIIHSNSCRNISKEPHLSAKHCYPLFDIDKWEKGLKVRMHEITMAFQDLMRDHKKSANYRYPTILLLPSELQQTRNSGL